MKNYCLALSYPEADAWTVDSPTLFVVVKGRSYGAAAGLVILRQEPGTGRELSPTPSYL